jgi:hypothetical protein
MNKFSQAEYDELFGRLRSSDLRGHHLLATLYEAYLTKVNELEEARREGRENADRCAGGESWPAL